MAKFAQRFWNEVEVHPSSRVSLAMRAAGVQKSPELLRVLGLPRRALDLENVLDVTDLYRKPGGTLKLRPVQSAALLELEEANGLVGSISVGWGKTLILLLAPAVMNSKRAVILVPPELKRQLVERDIPFYGKHFELPLDRITIVTYSELSSASKADVLERVNPDLIVADEAHRLRRKDSARTRRFLRFVDEHPECCYAFLSGSLTSKSIRDYAHFSEIALRKGSPLPKDWRSLSDWADAIDALPKGAKAMEPGALVLLCKDDEEPVREGFRRRLVETRGWVATDSQAFGGSLYLRELRPKVPSTVEGALRKLREIWEVGGEEISDPMTLARVARQLACGFYYRWDWPGGKVDHDWLRARADFYRELRGFLVSGNRPGLDSPLLVHRALSGGLLQFESWEAWKALKDRPVPPTEAVWIDDYIVRHAVAWGQEPGIIWTPHVAVGEEVAHHGGFEFFGEGSDAGTADGARTIVCTMAQSEGKNLQAWSRSLILSPSPNPKVAEQVIGRTHRPGQLSDEVWVDVMLQTTENEEALDAAIQAARYVKETQGTDQKILLATRLREDGAPSAL